MIDPDPLQASRLSSLTDTGLRSGPEGQQHRACVEVSRERLDDSCCSTAIECDATDRKLPRPDRSHKPWREANGGAQCGKSARCVATWRGLETWHGREACRRACSGCRAAYR